MNVIELNAAACTGCACCVVKCPVDCISLSEDKEGFFVPSVDLSKCINCSVCVNSCQITHGVEKSPAIKSFAAQRVKKEALLDSSSGGIATLISEKTLESGGVVYACTMDSEFNVSHTRIDNPEGLKKASGSKYVQSDFSNVYRTIEEDCKSGKNITVIGTPCQIAGVKLFLKKEYNNLLLVDLICHGVPNQKAFQRYLEWKRKKVGKSIQEYIFRDKRRNGWGPFYTVVTDSSIHRGSASCDPYYAAFENGEMYRESCYQCNYSCRNRVGDITLGDYWGIENEHAEFSEVSNNGISSVLCNSQKGLACWDRIKEKTIWVESTVDQIACHNANLEHPTNRPEIRDTFINKVLEKRGFEWANRRLHTSPEYYISMCRFYFPKSIKQQIKKILIKVKSL